MGAVGGTYEVLAAEQIPGGPDTTQDDSAFDLGAEIRRHKAQRADDTEHPAEDTYMAASDTDPMAPPSSQDIIRHL